MVRDRLNESEFETVITGMESINSTSSKQRVKSRTYLTDAIFFILFNVTQLAAAPDGKIEKFSGVEAS